MVPEKEKFIWYAFTDDHAWDDVIGMRSADNRMYSNLMSYAAMTFAGRGFENIKIEIEFDRLENVRWVQANSDWQLKGFQTEAVYSLGIDCALSFIEGDYTAYILKAWVPRSNE